MIRNPILPGFHPDPSIVRVGADYYVATSTFEWAPGVALHHSTDLVRWTPAGHVLTSPALVELRGVPDSAGVWAPSLSHHDGQFWLVFTVTRTSGTFMDVVNFLTTAPDVTGPWSAPVRLNTTGFDPSLFHDEDGRTWLTQIQWDFRPDHNSFGGIVLQEYDPARCRLVGEPTTILRTDDLVEAPNLYRHGGWYHLLLAEGGTGWQHGVGTARSRSLTGPYQRDRAGPVMTSRHDASLPLQKAGHGELVRTPDDEWYMVHLAGRPVRTDDGRFCLLGRETCVQRVEWSVDGWLRLAGGGTTAEVAVPAPKAALGADAVAEGTGRVDHDDFDASRLGAGWNSLRVPADDSWADLRTRPGWLRLRGRESLRSLFEQSLLAKRLTSVSCEVTTRMAFAPSHFTQVAGLIAWYDTSTHYYLRITWDERVGPVIGVVLSDDFDYRELREHDVALVPGGEVWLRAVLSGPALEFFFSIDGQDFRPIGSVLDATRISDDHGSRLRFTGAMVGLCAQDLNGGGTTADFDFFTVINR